MAAIDYAKINERLTELSKANQTVLMPAKGGLPSGTVDIAKQKAEEVKTRVASQKGQFYSVSPTPSDAYRSAYEKYSTGAVGTGMDKASQLMAYSKQIGGPDLGTILGGLGAQDYGSEATGRNFGMVESVLRDFESQQMSMQQQATNRAAATDLMKEATLTAGENLDKIALDAKGRMEAAVGGWDIAIGKANEYVEAGRQRTKQIMAQVDEMAQEMIERHDFSKAHAMQVGVQATIGSMQGMEKEVVAQFGKDSEEYMQFRGQKMKSLALMQSNVHSAYDQLRIQMDMSILKSTADAGTTMAMYENYQEQASLGIYSAAASANQAYDLQYTNTLIGIEQLKTQNMAGLAEWIESTPVFSVETGPMMALITSLFED